ncbi:MAG: efflux RND transporter periplasmic adaptor subunit [Oscillospiraceae bacterium]
MKIKSAVWTMLICSAVTAGLIAAPEIVLKNIPTAKVVEIEKIQHIDAISLSGTIIKNIRDDEFIVQIYVPEQDISKVELGQKAEITGVAFPNLTYDGEVESISDVASKIQVGNTQKTSVEVKVKINEPNEILKHGYTAEVKLITSPPCTMNIVPYEAINQDENGEYVYILKNGRTEKRYVETGTELSDGVELKTLIMDNEYIVTVDEVIENNSSVKIAD